MMPPAYYRETRAMRKALDICMKCGKRDPEFPYTCCTACRKQQASMDKKRAENKSTQPLDGSSVTRDTGTSG